MSVSRSALVRQELKRCGVDALLLTHPANITWACGLVSSNALLYLDTSQQIIATDGRYAEAAKRLEKGCTVVVAKQGQSLTSTLRPRLDPTVKRIGYQAEYVSVAAAESLKRTFSAPDFELTPLTGILDRHVAVKTASEIASMTKAQRATEAAFQEILTIIKPGVTEKAIAAELVYRQLQHGADGIAAEFWPVVAFGANSALPHAHAGETKLKRGDVVLLDFGCTVDGYCSDMTRTFVCGQPSTKLRTVYNVVLRAQEAGLAAVRSGAITSRVDAAAREVIAAAGYGEQFGHSLGHSVGLEIHEWPRLSPNTSDKLPLGAVVTVEPGIYLPGKFGVRIEDMVVVEKDACRNLTTAPKKLIVL